MPADILGVPVFAIKVNGQTLKDTVLWQITRITVDDQVDLPSMFTLDLDANEDNQPAWLDDEKLFAIGDEITIQIKSANTDLKTVISGEVTFLEVECSASQPSRLLVRGYDRRHRLQRGHKMRSFVKLKDSEIVKKIASEAGLSTNAVDSKVKHEYMVQANQTDFAFLQERARQIHYELLIQDKTLIFRPVANDKPPSITLSSEAELTEFRVQLSTTGQVNEASVHGWDVKKKAAIVGKSSQGALMGGGNSGGKLSKKSFGEAKAQLTQQPVMSKEEADQLATAAFAANALSFIQGEGSCQGRTDLKAGITVKIEGIGKRFNGPYYITKVNHTFDAHGFSTNFTAWRNAL